MTQREDRYGRAAALVRPDEGLINRRIFVDSDVYEAEMERIFARCWLFVGHESQVAQPGDFVTTYMGEDPVIVVRDRAGELQVLLNSCSHKGRRVCEVDEGRIATFVCPYHGWSYRTNGQLVGVPNSADAYYGELDKSALGLRRVARVDTYKGLIFATWDATAPSLREYLGDICWYLDIALDRSAEGTELVGSVQKWRVKANWKTGADNFVSDFQHAQSIAHASALTVTGVPVAPPSAGGQANAGPGHGLFFFRDVSTELRPNGTAGWMSQHFPHAADRLGELRGRGEVDPIAGTIFPNLSFNLLPTIPNLRMWMPRGPHEMEVWCWGIVDAGVADDVKLQMQRSFQFMFGPGGIVEQDDGDHWAGVTDAGRGFVTSQGWSHMTMGLGHETFDPDLPGEHGLLISESNARAYYRRWRDLLLADSWDDLPASTHSSAARAVAR